MKKILDFVSSKKYYLLLLAGIIAVTGITFVTRLNNKENMELVDLNGSNLMEDEASYNEQIVENDIFIESSNGYIDDNISKSLLNPNDYIYDEKTATIIDRENTTDSPDGGIEDDLEGEEVAVVEDVAEVVAVVEEEEGAVAEVFSNSTKEVISENNENANDLVINKNELSFNKDEGIIMPLVGSKIIAYDTSNPVYFKTLNHYRTSSATYISSAKGEEVKAVYSGKVKAITNDEMYGTMLTIEHGDSVESIYGQIEVGGNLNEGDYVKQGEVIGIVASPTKYFTSEGAHLYFKMIDSQQSVNPDDLVVQ